MPLRYLGGADVARTDEDTRSVNQRARDALFVKWILDAEASRAELDDGARFSLLAAAVWIDRIRADCWRAEEQLHPQWEELPLDR